MYVKIDGGLTDPGLQYIEENNPNVRWMLFGNVRRTGEWLLDFLSYPLNLKKLWISHLLH